MENKKEYLKKYLNEEPKKKKKKIKVKKPVVSNPRIKIIDDDINVKSLAYDSEEEEIGEEAPQIVEIIDETRKARWKKLGEDSTENMPSKRLDSDSDLSPSRTILGNQQNSEHLQRKTRYDTDSDQSLPRPNQNQSKTNYSDDDLSPLRNKRKNYESDSDQSLQRSHSNKRHSEKLRKKQSEGSDTENGRMSRKKHKKKHKKHRRKSESPEVTRKNKRVRSDSDQSPVRSSNSQENYKMKMKKHSRRHDSTSDESGHKYKDYDLLSSRKTRGNKRYSDSDQSPARYFSNQESYKVKKKKYSKRHDSDSDKSDQMHKDNDLLSLRKTPGNKRIHSDSDQSPARYSNNQETSIVKKKKFSKRHDSDSEESDHRHKDLSPLKKPHGKERGNEKVDNEKHDKKFNEEIKKPSKKESKQISNVELDIDQKEVNNEDNQEKGVSETSIDENKEETEISSTPFARYKDDPELEKHLKNKEREGDPMLAYIRKKKSKNQDGSAENVQVYKGPPPPPNRFNIDPGHKWDGVDRSNGYEKKYFDNIAQRKAYEELAYKWSVEDM